MRGRSSTATASDVTGVRNFDYRTRDDFTVRYEEREVRLSHLTALDFYVSYFMAGPVGHTFPEFHLRQCAAAQHSPSRRGRRWERALRRSPRSSSNSS